MVVVKKMYVFLLCSVSLWAFAQAAKVGTISVTNGAPQGLWRLWDYCPRNQHAVGFSLKVEPERGLFEDDTAVNSICLACVEDSNTTAITWACSGEGDFGAYSGYFSCPVINDVPLYLSAFQLKVDPDDGNTDETAVNNIQFACKPKFDSPFEEVIEGYGVEINRPAYGNWSDYCPVGSAICGIQTRVQPNQAILDDSALNDVKFECCDWEAISDEDELQ